MNNKSIEEAKLKDFYPDAKSWFELLGIVLAATTSICVVSVLIISYVVGIDILT
tara:strand:+ start:5646 stop:5807 length:162 start_codon:yes stop_codon:yes gene_type:complete